MSTQQTKVQQYLYVMWQLIQTDLKIYRKSIVSQMINMACWVTTIILTAAYVLPQLGMQAGYGAFIAVSSIATLALFDSFGNIAMFLADLEGNRTITFPLTLPLPTWMVFIGHGFFVTIKITVLTLMVLPIAKLLLWNNLDLSHMSIWKTILMTFSIQLFSGFYCLFMISIVTSMQHVMKVWMRFIFPLWFFGGSQFSWMTLNKFLPSLSYAALANPFLYGMEGIHSAVLGQEGYLPFWGCIAALWLVSGLFGLIAVKKLKKRLDFV